MCEIKRDPEIMSGSSELELSSYKCGVVNLCLKEPMKLPFGLITTRPSGIVSVLVQTNGSGIAYGFGEGASLPKPLFTDDCEATLAVASRMLLNELSDKGSLHLSKVVETIHDFPFSHNQRYPTARMMVEMAVLDGYSKALNIPIRDLLGVPEEVVSVPYGKSIGAASAKEIISQSLDADIKGATKIKIKISPEIFDEVSDAVKYLKVRGGFQIMADANGTFDPENANHIAMLEKLDKLGLIMIEEPVSRVGRLRGIEAIEKVRKNINFDTPICLDDCLIDLNITNYAIENKLAEILNIKPGRIGSIIESVKLATRCKEVGMEVMVGGMLEATPGRCMTVTLAALFHSIGFQIPGDLSIPQERLSEDLVPEERFLKYNRDGEVVLPKNSGWGFGELTDF